MAPPSCDVVQHLLSYGLTAALFNRKMTRYLNASRRLSADMADINCVEGFSVMEQKGKTAALGLNGM